MRTGAGPRPRLTSAIARWLAASALALVAWVRPAVAQKTDSVWIRNGDRWHVLAVAPDGSLEIERAGKRLGGTVTLPSAYVAESVDLGYAVTAHRAQGLTVDTAHVVVTGSTTRENFYVFMTRGRDTNTAYVSLDQPDDSHSSLQNAHVSGRSVLYGVLKHRGAELSAH